MSLFRRAVAVNVTVLVMAALVLALSPATVSATVTPSEWIVLTAGTAAVIVVNLLLLRRVFGPLERLEQVMGRIDPREPGRRIGEGRGGREIANVSKAFNSMLDRLERERADGRRRALRAGGRAGPGRPRAARRSRAAAYRSGVSARGSRR
jgi:two-component system, NarL family, sensor histidine kinase UhpB